MRSYTMGNMPLYYGQHAPMLWATCPFFSDADMVRLTFLTFLSLNTVRITLLTGYSNFTIIYEIYSKDRIELHIKTWQDFESHVDLYEIIFLCPKSYICNFTIDEIVKNKAVSREEINKLREAYKQSECAKEGISNENP